MLSSWQHFMALSAASERSLELKQYINAFYTIFCCVPFNVQACQMTPRTEAPSHKRWQRLKLACPRFVHYDEQIMFLHVYWLFCQMVHQAFHDHTALPDGDCETKQTTCKSNFSSTNGTGTDHRTRFMFQHTVTISRFSINSICQFFFLYFPFYDLSII